MEHLGKEPAFCHQCWLAHFHNDCNTKETRIKGPGFYLPFLLLFPGCFSSWLSSGIDSIGRCPASCLACGLVISLLSCNVGKWSLNPLESTSLRPLLSGKKNVGLDFGPLQCQGFAQCFCMLLAKLNSKKVEIELDALQAVLICC